MQLVSTPSEKPFKLEVSAIPLYYPLICFTDFGILQLSVRKKTRIRVLLAKRYKTRDIEEISQISYPEGESHSQYQKQIVLNNFRVGEGDGLSFKSWD